MSDRVPDPRRRSTIWSSVRIAGVDVVRRPAEARRQIGVVTQSNLEEADLLAGRLIVLDGGVQVADGTPAALRDRVGADTLLVATLDRREARLETDLATIPGVAHRRRGRTAARLRAPPRRPDR